MNEENPYQSPASLDESPALDGFYTTKLTALRYAELWRITSRWDSFIYGALAKALRWPTTSSTAFKALDPFKVLREDELSTIAREKLMPAIVSCRELGLEPAFYCTNERRGPNEAYGAHCLNQPGTISAGLTWVQVRVKHVIKERLTCSLHSWLRDGAVLSISNQRPMFDAPEIFQRLHLPGATMAELLRRHSERLQAMDLERVVRLDRDQLLDRMNANKRRIAEFHIRRGVWVPQPEETVNVNAIT